jgi:ribose transport system permease protein
VTGIVTRLRGQRAVVALVAFVVLVLVNVILQPAFFQPAIMQSNLTTFLPLVLVAIGQTYVVLGGDIDLSVGSIIALVNVVAVSVMAAMGGQSTEAALAGMAAGIAAGLCAGAFNGVCVAFLRFQPIVTTFATGIIFAGLALWVLPQAGLAVPDFYWQGYAGRLLGVPTVAWILLATIAAVVFVQLRPFHKHLAAVGGNRAGAFQTGLGVAGIRLGSFCLSGLCAALTALCLIGETASGDPLMGQSLALSSISAVVLGGTALSGGSGGALGSVLGALVLGMIGSVIFFAHLPFEYQTVVQGLIVLAALASGVLVTSR